jgi:hypothetical protein
MRLYGRAIVVGVAVMTILLGTAVTAVAASSRSGSGEPARHGVLLRSGLIGRPADASTTVIRGMLPGAAPWALRRGSIQVNAAGQFSFEVRGLLITGTGTSLDGTTGPVTSVIPELTCEGATPTTPTIVSAGVVQLSSEGDAKVRERIALPATCLAPIVLVLANVGSADRWIATTGF